MALTLSIKDSYINISSFISTNTRIKCSGLQIPRIATYKRLLNVRTDGMALEEVLSMKQSLFYTDNEALFAILNTKNVKIKASDAVDSSLRFIYNALWYAIQKSSCLCCARKF
jgi:hypothetical protein